MENLQNLITQVFPQVIAHRRHLHQHPELSFQEHKTSEYIQSVLEKNQIPYSAGWVKTGVVALIRGKNPEKRCIALRADMDALPVQEENEVPYKSVHPGIMHACGHDAHTAMLLGAGIVLNQVKTEFEGSIKLIFQPGEEKLPGGASLMIKENVLKNPKVDSAIAQHVYPELDVGKIGVRSGTYMASTDEIYLTVRGKGGHAALPHKLTDPVMIAVQMLSNLQQIVSRYASPYIPVVLSFGKIVADGATNVIPNEVQIAGTLRTFDEELRNTIHQKIEEIATHTAAAFGGKCEVNIVKGYPVLKNDAKLYEVVKQSAIEVVGKQNVVELGLRMTAEDFSYFSQEVPSFFYRLGTGASEGLHHPKFNIDEKALEIGTHMLVKTALNALNQ
ncbi:MAG: amidohydrolase [Bacteroidetes bacterium]|nr:MAG: amidohydrolase [Bacteroidota bacterium]